ncbi:hypothetical protein [Schaalia sp. ZJ1691]|uniref:hypothetical protein n=1 Tax=Schaalia sp. ZJ1691 TaxID=2709404 RepID=UPI0013EC9299|nr:hypothetical protein [Schaalia sp. ZJ1691]
MKRAPILVATFAATIALAGCAGETVAPPTAESAQSSSMPNLDTERIDSALTNVSEALAAADKAKDSTLFKGRLIDGAARMRSAQYTLAAASGGELPELDMKPQNLAITNSSTWPRAIINITGRESAALPVVEVLVQQDPRSPYALTSWSRLLAGTSLTLPAISSGSGFVSDDATGFVLTPKEALNSYVAMLNAREVNTEKFTSDEYTTKYFDTLTQLSTNLAVAGTVTAQVSASDMPICGVVMQDGSALVAAHFTYTLTYARTIAKSTMRLGGQTAVLYDGEGDKVVGTATAHYLGTVILRIPSAKAGGQIQVIGGERTIEKVDRDDSSNPDA